MKILRKNVTGAHRSRILAMCLTMIVLMLMASASVFAADLHRMPELQDTKGSLKVILTYTNENEETGIVPGALLCVYKVADLTVEGGSANYTLTTEFASSEIQFEGMTASQSHEAAAILQVLTETEAISGFQGMTGEDGSALFTNLDAGMYLVYRDPADMNDEDRSIMSPFLVSVPLAEQKAEGNSWLYQVTAMPKMIVPSPNDGYLEETETETEKIEITTEIETEKESVGTNKPQKVNTGDDTKILIWVVILAGCLAVMVGILFAKRSRNTRRR